jgi:hypothetical protein
MTAAASLDVDAFRPLWKGGASHIYYGCCATCGRLRTADGHPLVVARQERSRRGFECLECFAARNAPRRRRRRRAA